MYTNLDVGLYIWFIIHNLYWTYITYILWNNCFVKELSIIYKKKIKNVAKTPYNDSDKKNPRRCA